MTSCFRVFRVTILFTPLETWHSRRSGAWRGDSYKWCSSYNPSASAMLRWVGSEQCCDKTDKRLIKDPICALTATDALHKSHSTRLPTNKPHVISLQRWYAKRQWEEDNNGCEFKLSSLQSMQPKRISNSSSMQAGGGKLVQWHHLCVILHWLAYSPTVFLG